MSIQVDTQFIWVTDLEASLEWYRQIGKRTYNGQE